MKHRRRSLRRIVHSRKARRTKRYTRRRKQHGSGPVLESCGSGKCSTTGQTIVTYRGDDPVDSVPTFVSADEANKMYEEDQ